MKELRVQIKENDKDDYDLWIGGKMAFPDWEWLDEAPWSYANWQTEPKESTREMCVRVGKGGQKKWRSEECITMSRAVCEKVYREADYKIQLLTPSLKKEKKIIIPVFKTKEIWIRINTTVESYSNNETIRE